MKKDVWHLTPQEREFAAQNLDVTLNAVFSKEQMDADEAKKAEIMKCVLDGCQVDIARPDGKGSVEIIPLKASSDIPVLEAALSRQRYSGTEYLDYSETIKEHQNTPVSRESLKEADAEPTFTVNPKISEDLFQQMRGMNAWIADTKNSSGLCRPQRRRFWRIPNLSWGWRSSNR